MIFKSLLYYPSTFKHRQQDWKIQQANIIDIKITTDGILLTGQVKKYNQYILLNGSFLDNIPIKIACTCPSFKFEFAYALNKTNSLLYPDNFLDYNIAPKEKNIHRIESGCKHLITFANHIVRFRNKIKNIIEEKQNEQQSNR